MDEKRRIVSLIGFISVVLLLAVAIVFILIN